MSDTPRRIALAPAIVLGGAAGVLVIASLAYPRVASVPEPPAVVVQPVASNRLVCPDPIASAEVASTVTGFVAPGLAGQKGGSGAAALTTIPEKDGTPERVAIPKVGAARSLNASGAPLPPVAAVGRGGLAPGLALDQFTIGDRGRSRGLAAQQCFAAGTSQWFVGGASGVGRSGTVVLANPEDAPASVDVMLWGPSGPLPAPGGRGVLVPARGQVRLNLSQLAPGVAAFAIHVVTRSGRVVSAVSDQAVNGLVPRGLEWVPATTEPASTVLVAGIPARVTPVRLSVLSPTKDTTVRVRLLTPSGAFAPKGLTSLTVTAGKLEVVDLTKVLREQPAAVELVAEDPIVAGAEYRLGDAAGVGELAYAAGAPPLTGPAAVAGLPGGGYRHRLYLTNPNRERDATVLVTTISRDGAARRVTLKVPRGTTQVWTAEGPDARSYSIVVAPGRSAALVRVMRVTSLAATSGTMAAGVPMWPVRSEVSVPEALPNLGVAIG